MNNFVIYKRAYTKNQDLSPQPYFFLLKPGERLHCYPFIITECNKNLKNKSLTSQNQLSITWEVTRPDENEQEN